MKATAEARANIAFVKYWGRRDERLNLPLNDSISLTLDKLRTETLVELDAHLDRDHLVLNGKEASAAQTERASRHLDRLRFLAGRKERARIVTSNAFTTAGGLASSASGFAALTVAAAAALGLDLTPTEQSRVARLGSGSAARSLFGGYVRWRAGHDDASSVAEPLHPAGHWDLRDVIVNVERAEKKVGSAEGHGLAPTSPLLPSRLAALPHTLREVEAALEAKDIGRLGAAIEAEALSMHAVMMTSNPSLLYWTAETVRVLHLVRAWRDDGLPVYATLDAGPNPHLLCEARDAPKLLKRLEDERLGQHTLVCGPGEGPRLLARS